MFTMVSWAVASMPSWNSGHAEEEIWTNPFHGRVSYRILRLEGDNFEDRKHVCKTNVQFIWWVLVAG